MAKGGKMLQRTKGNAYEHQLHLCRGFFHPGFETAGGNPACRQMGPSAPGLSQRTPSDPV